MFISPSEFVPKATLAVVKSPLDVKSRPAPSAALQTGGKSDSEKVSNHCSYGPTSKFRYFAIANFMKSLDYSVRRCCVRD